MKTSKHNRSSAPRRSAEREFSSIVVDGPERAASRAMLHAVGFKRDDFRKSQVGIASTWSQVTPCNIHIDQLAVHVALGVNEAGGKALVFNTITVSDGISMGSEGMKYSLVSREVIADSIETVAGCEGMDGLVAIGGCTGMDIVSILQKKRLKLADLQIQVRGKRASDYPMVWTEIHLTYLVWGKDLQPRDVEQAIQLSEEKYCSVGIMLGKTAKITSEYKILKPGESVVQRSLA